VVVLVGLTGRYVMADERLPQRSTRPLAQAAPRAHHVRPDRRCPSRQIPIVVWANEPEDGFDRTEKTMFQTLSYQLYTATERPAGFTSGRIAAEIRDLRIRIGRAFRPRPRIQPARRPFAAARVAASGR
jgi:hypothetical protein